MAARWSGFYHPHLDVTYSISIGTTVGGSDVINMKNVGTSLSHKETGLTLTPYQVVSFWIEYMLKHLNERFLSLFIPFSDFKN